MLFYLVVVTESVLFCLFIVVAVVVVFGFLTELFYFYCIISINLNLSSFERIISGFSYFLRSNARKRLRRHRFINYWFSYDRFENYF